MAKGIDNAFDHMELCFVIFTVKISLLFQEITIITDSQLAIATHFFNRWQNRFSDGSLLLLISNPDRSARGNSIGWRCVGML